MKKIASEIWFRCVDRKVNVYHVRDTRKGVEIMIEPLRWKGCEDSQNAIPSISFIVSKEFYESTTLMKMEEWLYEQKFFWRYKRTVLMDWKNRYITPWQQGEHDL